MERVATKQKEKAEEIINKVLKKESVGDNIISKDPESFIVRVTRLAKNKNFVYGVLNGMLIEIFLPRRRENSIGKTITVVKADEIGENKYKVLQ
jgi:hypothetical protein